MSDRYKSLLEKSLQCIHAARTINDRYPDPTRMPAEALKDIQTLTKEGMRLKELAETEKARSDLEAWGQAPDADNPALSAMAAVGAAHAKTAGGVDAFAEANKSLQLERFAKALRHGPRSLNAEEKAALVENATGEVIVPHDIAGPIFKTLPRLGIIRSLGPLIRPTTSNKVDMRSLTNATAGWGKLEVGSTPATDANVVPNTPVDVVEVHDLLALEKIGVDELADTDANLVALVQEICGEQFAQQEDDAFANGNGTSKPWGLAMRATQASPLITQAVTAAANATVTGDELKKLQMRVPARFRVDGKYVASADATEAIMLLKDANSNYLWQPSVREGEPETLFGKGFATVEGLPSMGASAAAVDPSVLFGNFRAGYLVADRQLITLQRLDELYAADGQVGFLFKLRVGGDVLRPAAFAKYLL